MSRVSRHARQRAVERFGRDLTDAEWRDAVQSIMDGRAVLLTLTPEGGQHYLHHAAGMRMRLVWDPETAVLITVNLATAPPSRVVRQAAQGRNRKSFERPAQYVRGKRLKRLTRWETQE